MIYITKRVGGNQPFSETITSAGESHDNCKRTREGRTDPSGAAVARAYWRVTIHNPPINVMGPEKLREFQEVIGAPEADEQVRVEVFDSAADDYFLSHSDFSAKLKDLISMPDGPTGLPPWPDFLAR